MENVFAILTSQKSPSGEKKHKVGILSCLRLFRTLMVFPLCRCHSAWWQTVLSWRSQEERLHAVTHASAETTPGWVSCRQHVTGLKWSQGRYESRHCLSKPGSNQAHHPPKGPSWKSLLLNNVLLLLLVWNNNNSNNTYHYYHDHLRGSLLRGVFWGKTTARCQGCGCWCWKKKNWSAFMFPSWL